MLMEESKDVFFEKVELECRDMCILRALLAHPKSDCTVANNFHDSVIQVVFLKQKAVY